MNIDRIKILGERNSGTNYLEKLLENNLKNINILSQIYNGGSGWKHGFPNLKLFKNLDKILFIFIIRDLKSWLKSMFKQPYHYKSPQTFNEFLSQKLTIDEKRKDHDVNVNILEKDNIINLRYSKINSYFDFFKNVNHAIFIHLEDLQLHPSNFLNFLNKTYLIEKKKNFINIIEHTKDKNLKMRNRKWNVVMPEKINNANNDIEDFVENLKKKYYYKKNNLIL